ncbi:photosynthetic complex putative assembly protein PuhB [Aurantiacibacter poecillastricola]|uniref:photosynthetic complex putative assembly protein PuhB n=1 Tax=Aurantiacibacter poecillastricola TaxID=3064385 RepID=UPI00273E8478|nr:photosynthetic complex putative assembly protein PuhB [Aurantiacibacter sp. 219JJ12-13]MDP5260400.1 photosynthetic complex putative assembly protein PuhB [Aurantiacibacter sp. 219JJ12-13]
MIMEHESEPVRGLPGKLPEGERMLWQGAPDWRIFARTALHTRWIGGYFGLLALLALVTGSPVGAVVTVLGGLLCQALFAGFAVLVARTTVYTITDRRIVLRIGVALSTCINLPLKAIGSADLRELPGDAGDIALTLTQEHRLGYAVLWPHARPWRFGKPQPMLRALAHAPEAAKILTKACASASATVRKDSCDRDLAPVPLREAAA